MRIVLETPEWVAVAFRVHAAEFVREEDLARYTPLATLGPDLLSDAFDDDEAIGRMRAHPGEPMAEILLNQRIMAGIGNIYKSEVLFLAGVHPDTTVAALADDRLRDIIATARKLLLANVSESTGLPRRSSEGFGRAKAGLRRTTGRMRPEDRLWVYSRGGRACRKCGTAIASRKDGDDARVTYWCPVCQPKPL